MKRRGFLRAFLGAVGLGFLCPKAEANKPEYQPDVALVFWLRVKELFSHPLVKWKNMDFSQGSVFMEPGVEMLFSVNGVLANPLTGFDELRRESLKPITIGKYRLFPTNFDFTQESDSEEYSGYFSWQGEVKEIK